MTSQEEDDQDEDALPLTNGLPMQDRSDVLDPSEVGGQSVAEDTDPASWTAQTVTRKSELVKDCLILRPEDPPEATGLGHGPDTGAATDAAGDDRSGPEKVGGGLWTFWHGAHTCP